MNLQQEKQRILEEITNNVVDTIFNRESGWSLKLETYLSDSLSQYAKATLESVGEDEMWPKESSYFSEEPLMQTVVREHNKEISAANSVIEKLKENV